MIYDSAEYAGSRLVGSIVTLGNKFYSVVNVRDNMCVDLGWDGRILLQEHISNLQLTRIPLGYIRLNSGSIVYVSREPRRQYLQGITNSCVDIIVKSGQLDDIDISTFLADCCYKNEHQIISDDTILNRSWLLVGDRVEFEGEVVGTRKRDSILLLPSYTFLQDLLDEVSYAYKKQGWCQEY